MRIIFLIIALSVMTVSADVIVMNSVLDIQVRNHTEFSGRFTVESPGIINYPLLADEVIVNMTTSELMNELTFRLARHIENPLVLISVIRRPPIVVTVLGAVEKPGPIELLSGAMPQEALQPAGGVTADADLSKLKIIRGKNSESSINVNLTDFMKTGSMRNIPMLENNDVVVVLGKDRQTKVKVIGAVAKPGFYDLVDSINVFEVIYLAGGPAEKADMSRVRRFTKYEGHETEEVLNIRALMDNGEMSKIPRVNEGDIIIVYSRWFDWKVFMTVLTNVLLFIVTIQSIKTAVATQ